MFLTAVVKIKLNNHSKKELFSLPRETPHSITKYLHTFMIPLSYQKHGWQANASQQVLKC